MFFGETVLFKADLQSTPDRIVTQKDVERCNKQLCRCYRSSAFFENCTETNLSNLKKLTSACVTFARDMNAKLELWAFEEIDELAFVFHKKEFSFLPPFLFPNGEIADLIPEITVFVSKRFRGDSCIAVSFVLLREIV